jgi:hypothetical protein
MRKFPGLNSRMAIAAPMCLWPTFPPSWPGTHITVQGRDTSGEHVVCSYSQQSKKLRVICAPNGLCIHHISPDLHNPRLPNPYFKKIVELFL